MLRRLRKTGVGEGWRMEVRLTRREQDGTLFPPALTLASSELVLLTSKVYAVPSAHSPL
jgi:hypothetical protein